MRRILTAADAEATGPTYLREELRFPYLAGGAFVEHLFRRGGWRAVDRAYEVPPASTEQILHPERYPSDAPVAIEVPDDVRPRADARRIFDDVLGERGVRALFRNVGLGRLAEPVAEGWDGDRAVVWEAAGKLSLLWSTAWDTEDDARAFAAAYRDLVVRSYRTRALRRDQQDEVAWATPEGPVRIRRDGTRVLVTEGFTPGETREASATSAAPSVSP
jgi:hypothetical protein